MFDKVLSLLGFLIASLLGYLGYLLQKKDHSDNAQRMLISNEFNTLSEKLEEEIEDLKRKNQSLELLLKESEMKLVSQQILLARLSGDIDEIQIYLRDKILPRLIKSRKY